MEEQNPFELAGRLEKEKQEQNPFELAGQAELKKKDYPESSSPNGGKVGASETPSIGSSPFLQRAKERVERGEPTVANFKTTFHPDSFRPDGTKKDIGFLGEFKTPSGKSVTEYSIGVPVNGKEMDIPTLVPTLTEEERKYIIDKAEREEQIGRDAIGNSIVNKAIAHAEQRIKEGKSPFFSSSEKETPSTGNETAELLGIRPAPKTEAEFKAIIPVPKTSEESAKRITSLYEQKAKKTDDFIKEKAKLNEVESKLASVKEGTEEHNALIEEKNKLVKSHNKALADRNILAGEIHAAEVANNEKYGKGNRMGYLYNSFLKGIGSMSSGVADAFMNVAKEIPGAVAPSMSKEEAVETFRKQVEPAIREGIKKQAGVEVVPEKEKKYNDEFWTSAIGGLTSSAPAMVTPFGTGLYAQAYDSGLESINSSKEGEKLPETTKTIFAASVGAAQGLLEKYGLDKIFGKQSAAAARKLASDAITELADKGVKNVTTEAFEKMLEGGVKSLKDKVLKAGGKIGEGALVEFGTGAAQEASTIAAEKLVNASEGKDIFEPTSWGEMVGRIAYSGAQESVGGGLMGAAAAPFSKTRSYIAEQVANAKTQEDYQKLRAEFTENVSPEEAELANKIIDHYANVNSKIPENVPNRKEVIEKVVEREDIKDVIAQKQQELEQVDEAFKPKIEAEIETLNGRIQEINEEIINQPLNTQQTEAAKPMVTEVQFTTKQRERRDQEIEEVQQLRNDLGQDVELINDIPGFVDDIVDRIDLGMMVAPEMLSDAIKELDNQFDKLQAYRNDPARTHTTAQIDAMIDVLGAVKSEIQDYQIKQKENGQKQQTAAAQTEPTVAPTEGVKTGQTEITQEQLSTPNINQNETVNENVREIGNGQKDGQKGDVSQEAKSDVQEGEEKVAEGEEPTAEQVDKASKAVGTTPSNLRDLYRVNRDLFGQNRVRAFASAIAMDRMIGAMAKRAGIPKQRMYEKLQFRKASEEFVKGLSDRAKVLWQIVGENAQLAQDVRDNLQVARDMEAAGKDAKTIRLSTGWEKGKDGKWRYEIFAKPPFNVKLNLKFNQPKVELTNDKEATHHSQKLGDIINFPQLFEAYPKLKNLQVDLYIGGSDGVQGSYSSAGEYMLGIELFAENEKLALSGLLHEIQHAIQDIEGFAKGGSPSGLGSVEALVKQARKERRKLGEKYNELEQERAELLKIKNPNKEQQKRFEETIKEQNKLEEDARLLKEVEENPQNVSESKIQELAYKGYKSLAGEVEARNVQTRMAMTPEQRRETLLSETEDVARDEQIVLFQKDVEKARGAMMMALDGQAIIYALSDPNVSTPLHELAHVFEHYLTESERQTIIRNAGTGAWTTETSEYFARGFEKYLAEGVAPTKELQKVFEKFKEWLTEIYNGIIGSEIDIQLNDEMRAIYAQMFGEEEVTQEQLLTSNINQDETRQKSAVQPQRTGDGKRRTDSGAIAPLKDAPAVQGATGPDSQLVAVAEKYAADNGIDLKRQSEYVEVDEERAKNIAQAYEEMAHDPQNPKVKEAYAELIKQTIAQYQALVDAGYKFWFMDLNIPNNVEYAKTPYNAMRDLRQNKQMGVFPTTDGFGTSELDVNDNPLLAETGFEWPVGGLNGKMKPVLANDLFRAVHDTFGHGLEGSGFRARGEENAWQAHIRLYTGAAKGAITSETRGQNSWLNFGPYGEKNRISKVEDTIFADQKTGLMPEWTWTEGLAGDMQGEGDVIEPFPKASDEILTKQRPNEKITQKENGKPLPEGVSGVRTETEERKTSPELRPQEEEVRSIIDNAVANFYAINEATKRSEKREAAKEYRQNLEKMPTVKNIFDNIKTIFAQLEAEGIITKSKDCP